MVFGDLGILIAILSVGTVVAAGGLVVWLAVRRRAGRGPHGFEGAIRILCGTAAAGILGVVGYATWVNLDALRREEKPAPQTVRVPTRPLEEIFKAHPEWQEGQGGSGADMVVCHVLAVDDLADKPRALAGQTHRGRRVWGSLEVRGQRLDYDIDVQHLVVQRDTATGKLSLAGRVHYEAGPHDKGPGGRLGGWCNFAGGCLRLMDMPGEASPSAVSAVALGGSPRLAWPHPVVLVVQVAEPDDPLVPRDASDLAAGVDGAALAPRTGMFWWNNKRIPTDLDLEGHNDPPAAGFFERVGPGGVLVLLAAVLAGRAMFRRPGWALLGLLPMAVLAMAAFERGVVGAHLRDMADAGLSNETRMRACVNASETFLWRGRASAAFVRLNEEASAPRALRSVAGQVSRVMDARWARDRHRISISWGSGLPVRGEGIPEGASLGMQMYGDENGRPILICLRLEGGDGVINRWGMARVILAQPGTYRRIVVVDDDLRGQVLGTEADFEEASRSIAHDAPPPWKAEVFRRVVVPYVREAYRRAKGGR